MASQRSWSSPTAYAALVRGERMAPTYYDHFPLHPPTWLGVTQIVCSLGITVVCCVYFGVIFGIVTTLVIQFPLMAIIAGSFGICAGVKKTTCKIVTNMVMSILVSINSCALAIVAATSLGLFEVIQARLQDDHYYNNMPMYSKGIADTRGYLIALLVLSLVETVAAITSAIIGCHFVCFCCKNCCCKYDVTTTDHVMMMQSNDEERLLAGCETLSRNDSDVPMIPVDGAAGVSIPFTGSNYVVQPAPFIAFVK